MSPNTSRPADDESRHDHELQTEHGQGDAMAGNPYASQYQERTAEADLDAGAPLLRSNDIRRMNQRALLMLGAVVLLLLLLAYWMISGAMGPKEKPRIREEKVTVAEAPAAIAMPVPPPPVAQPVPAKAIPLMPAPEPRSSDATPPAIARAPAGPSLLERRIEAGQASSGADTATPDAPGPLNASLNSSGLPGNKDASRASASPLAHPDSLMQRGTYIRCILETRIVSDISGYSTCLVAEPVYSFNGHTLLLPKGSKILGTYKGEQQHRRIAVVWDRIITPTGIDVNMESPGIDNLGGAGLTGHYDAHWGSRIGAALLISMLSDAFKYEAAEHGPTTTTYSSGVVTQEPFQSNTAQTVQNLANQATREATNRAPTVTINQGTLIYVYVSKDVDFSGVVARL